MSKLNETDKLKVLYLKINFNVKEAGGQAGGVGEVEGGEEEMEDLGQELALLFQTPARQSRSPVRRSLRSRGAAPEVSLGRATRKRGGRI